MKRVSRPRPLGALVAAIALGALLLALVSPGERPTFAAARGGAQSAAEAIAEEAWLGVRWQSLLPGMMK